MRAARAHAGSAALSVEDVPDPAPRPGSAIVRIETTFTSHFISKIVDGSGGYLTPARPFTPGMDAIGTVESVSPGVRGLTPGERVYCDPFYEPAHPGRTGERVFIGNFASGGAISLPLLAEWPDGAYAEKICLPADCVIPVDPGVTTPAAVLCRIGWLGTAYGAFRKVDMSPGSAVAVNGASGLLGSSAVVAALALGAGKVFAIGRRKQALDAVAAIDPRVEPVTEVAALPMIDVALSSVDGADSASLEALFPHVRRSGTFVLVGAPATPLAINAAWLMRNDVTIRGSLWFERAHATEMFALIAAGRMDLTHIQAETYPLSEVNEAIAAAHHRPNPLHHVAVSSA